MKKKIFSKVKKIGLYILTGIGLVGALIFVGVICFLIFGQPVYNGVLSEGSLSSMETLQAPSKGALGISMEMESGSAANELAPETESMSEGELTQRKVVRNGSLSILVKKTEQAAENIQNITKDLGGFVAYSRVYEVSEGTKSGIVTIRVPANFFDEAMNRVKELAVKVEDENTSSSDVTERFIDLEARLENLEAEEEQYLEVMEKAETVEDILKVSQRLSSVRGRIEQIQGQLKYLLDQIDMSTITVTLTAEEDVELFGIRWRPLFVVKQSFRSMLSGLRGYLYALIRFAFRLPVLILWLASIALLLFGAWKLLRWFVSCLKKKKRKKK